MGLRTKFLEIKRRVFPSLFTSDDMLKYLQGKRILVGKGTIFYHPGYTTVDTSRPCMLQIGEYCKIASGVIILAHDYSRSVLRRVYGEIIGEAEKTVIGNNVFIGMNSIILMGSKIGSNVIIGAGSVVKGSIPDNVVVAGNPAKIIRTLDEHYQHRKGRILDEALCFVKEFESFEGRLPTINELDPFFPLFMPRDVEELKKHGLRTALGGDKEADVLRDYLASEAQFDGYESFVAFYYKEQKRD